MDDFMIAIIVLLVILILCLIAIIIVMTVGTTNNSSYMQGTPVYLYGNTKQPLFIKQNTEPLVLNIPVEFGGSGSTTITRNVNRINGISKNWYEIAKSRYFILPCQIKAENAIFYDGSNKDHYCRLVDNKSAISGVSFGGLTKDIQKLSSTNKGKFFNDSIYLHYEDGQIVLRSGPNSSDPKILSEETTNRNLILENCIYPFKGDPTGALFPIQSSVQNNFGGVLKMTKDSTTAYVILRTQEDSQNANTSMDVYGTTYWYKPLQ